MRWSDKHWHRRFLDEKLFWLKEEAKHSHTHEKSINVSVNEYKCNLLLNANCVFISFVLMKKSRHKNTVNTHRHTVACAILCCTHHTFDAFSFYLQLASYTIYFLMITIIPIRLEFLHCSYKKTYRYTRLWTRNTLRSFHKIRVSVTFQFFSLLTAKRNLNREYALDNCLIAHF